MSALDHERSSSFGHVAPAAAHSHQAIRSADSAYALRGTYKGALWERLVDGRWSIVDCFDNGRRRTYLATERPQSSRSQFALSEREAQVSRMTGRGRANKEVAYALGLTTSSVATYIKRSLGKLRLQQRSELPFIIEESVLSLVGGKGGQPLLLVSALELRVHPTLTGAEQEVARMAAQGRSDRAIANARRSSARTVANLLRSAYRKLRVSNRTELASLSLRWAPGVTRLPMS